MLEPLYYRLSNAAEDKPRVRPLRFAPLFVATWWLPVMLSVSRILPALGLLALPSVLFAVFYQRNRDSKIIKVGLPFFATTIPAWVFMLTSGSVDSLALLMGYAYLTSSAIVLIGWGVKKRTIPTTLVSYIITLFLMVGCSLVYFYVADLSKTGNQIVNERLDFAC